MISTMLTMQTPGEMAQFLAAGAKVLRLLEGWTRAALAERAGVSVASLKRFETTGKASLELVLKIAHALGRLDEFDKLLKPPQAQSLADLEKQTTQRLRKRGSR